MSKSMCRSIKGDTIERQEPTKRLRSIRRSELKYQFRAKVMIGHPIERTIWQDIGRSLGGAVFCGAMGGLCYALAFQDLPSTIVQGIIVGSIVGAYLVTGGGVSAMFAKSIPVACSPHRANSGFATEIVNGIRTARFILVIFGIPFSVLCTAAACTILSIAALVIDGPSAGIATMIDVLNTCFWLCGLYLCVVIFVAGVSWALQCLGGFIQCTGSRARPGA